MRWQAARPERGGGGWTPRADGRASTAVGFPAARGGEPCHGDYFADSSLAAVVVGGARYNPPPAPAGTAPTPITNATASGVDDEAVLRSHHWGPTFAYGIPVTPGTYTIAAHWAETYGPASTAGARVFDVTVGGAPDAMVPAWTSVDVAAAVGGNAAMMLTKTVSVATEALLVHFTGTTQNAFVSALTITTEDGSFTGAAGTPQPPAAVVTPTPAAVVSPTPAAEVTPTPEVVETPTPAPVDGSAPIGPVGVPPGQPDAPGEPDDGAHAVPAGPYTAVADADDGSAEVTLDGRGSHTHNTGGDDDDDDGDEEGGALPGFGGLLAFTWSIFDTKEILGVEPTLTRRFPKGETHVMLTVKDYQGDIHSYDTTVTVTDGVTDGLVCYVHKGLTDLPPVGVAPSVAPAHVVVAPAVAFKGLADWGKFPYAAGDWLARCVGTVTAPAGDAGAAGLLAVKAGSGSARVAVEGTAVPAGGVASLPAGTHAVEVVYAHPAGGDAALSLTAPAGAFAHSAGEVLPVITGMTPANGALTGSGTVRLTGFGFLPGETVDVGGTAATILEDVAGETTAGEVSFTVPPRDADGAVPVTVTTRVGTSNAVTFTYSSAASAPVTPVYEETVLKGEDGEEFKLGGGTSIAVGPDGRVYIGNADKGRVHKLDVDFLTHTVTKACSVELGGQILGVAFSPADHAASPTLLVSVGDLKGGNWKSGKVVGLPSLPTGCFGTPKDIVTGLPVQVGHDHSVGRPAFDQNGDMLLPVGGMTNAGVKHPKSGDVAESPLSGAVVKVALSKGAAFDGKITYSTNDPASAKQTGGDVSVWASGVRNGLNVERHSSGTYWLVDNGANAGYGDVLVACNKAVSFKEAGDYNDRLLKLEEGGYYGHPNPNRGDKDERQCTYRKPNVQAPGFTPPEHLFKASTNGIAEQRTNVFGGAVKGHLFFSKFATGEEGVTHTAPVSATGKLGTVTVVKSYSGLNIAVTPFGSLYMPRVHQGKVVVLAAKYQTAGQGPMVMSVTPNRGRRAGGYRVYVAGHNLPEGAAVSFSGAPCTDVQRVGEVGLTCTMPEGTGKVAAEVAGVPVADGHDFEYLDV
ncbi:hypothetical protein I4F81_006884 [Pyropia yezoensis]|uniref:Uncharacterized protein n=1 Tax=Pyropia yezoensis TaxID=2788 RepID=A0ACC3C3N5_PYRYE|nr:hypothetical protein I4F81_006884 [Neopyropia yezoensis]